jgi:hypothetical protein
MRQNSQRKLRKRNVSSPFPSSERGGEQPQDSNSDIDILPFRRPQRNFRPMPHSQPKYKNLSQRLHTIKSKEMIKEPTVKGTQNEVSNCGRHVFVMDSSTNTAVANEVSDQEKADRAIFVQNIMLALLQNHQH